MNKWLFKDSAGCPSLTATAFILGFAIVNLKLLISGLTVFGFTMAAFSGSEYAMAIGALGAVYVIRRNAVDKNGDGKVDEQDNV